MNRHVLAAARTVAVVCAVAVLVVVRDPYVVVVTAAVLLAVVVNAVRSWRRRRAELAERFRKALLGGRAAAVDRLIRDELDAGHQVSVEDKRGFGCDIRDHGGKTYGFRAGSYGGYSRWREALTYAAFSVQPRTVWDAPDTYRDLPFFELINFADNEGTIGPDAAKDLAEDFVTQRGVVRADLAREQDWFAETYDEWQHAFTLAAGSGLVSLG